VIVSDDQVRDALALWFGQKDYARSLSPTASSMRVMREVLEAVDVEKSQDLWHTQTYQRQHEVYGLFSAFEVGGSWHAVRIWTPTIGGSSQMEQLGIHATANAARAQCDRILAEFDAANAEQLECR
jgi:hypothetical protein